MGGQNGASRCAVLSWYCFFEGWGDALEPSRPGGWWYISADADPSILAVAIATVFVESLAFTIVVHITSIHQTDWVSCPMIGSTQRD